MTTTKQVYKPRPGAVSQAARKRYYTKNKESLKARRIVKMTTVEGRLRETLALAKHSIKYKSRARRNLVCTITYEDLLELYNKQNGKCALSGRIMSTTTKELDVISLDRIDSTKGYTADNIQLVTGQVNRCKNAYTVDEFIAMCKAVALNRS